MNYDRKPKHKNNKKKKLISCYVLFLEQNLREFCSTYTVTAH